MKVTVIFKPWPTRRPEHLEKMEIECVSIERNYQAFENGPKWAFFNHPKGNWAFLEKIIVEVKEEPF